MLHGTQEAEKVMQKERELQKAMLDLEQQKENEKRMQMELKEKEDLTFQVKKSL